MRPLQPHSLLLSDYYCKLNDRDRTAGIFFLEDLKNPGEWEVGEALGSGSMARNALASC